MFCSSVQHRGREKKRDIFVAKMTRASRSPIQPAQKKTVNPDRYPQCTVVCAGEIGGLYREMTGGLEMRVTRSTFLARLHVRVKSPNVEDNVCAAV